MTGFLVSPTSEALASAHLDPSVNGVLQCCQPPVNKRKHICRVMIEGNVYAQCASNEHNWKIVPINCMFNVRNCSVDIDEI